MHNLDYPLDFVRTTYLESIMILISKNFNILAIKQT